jgi:Tol biopolymer transport system component
MGGRLVRITVGAVAALAIAVSSSISSAAAVPVAGSEAIVGWDACYSQLFTMKPDGTERRAFASTRRPTDVSRRGPLTALVPQRSVISDQSSPVVLWAIDVASGGVTTLISGYDAAYATFSPDANRIAFTRFNIDPNVAGFADLYVADVVRDGTTEAVLALTNISRVTDLLTIGLPSDSNAGGFTGALDFSRDGSSVVAVIYDDLWRIDLSGSTMTGATALTRTKDFAERFPRWSPAGPDVIAYSGGPYSTQPGSAAMGLSYGDMNIFTLDLLTHSNRALLTKQNHGQAGAGRDTPTWSPDANFVAFSAFGPNAPRKSSCRAVNFDVFKIRADGSGNAVNVTATTGNGVESNPHWAWR